MKEVGSNVHVQYSNPTDGDPYLIKLSHEVHENFSSHNLHVCFSIGCKIQDSFFVVVHQHSCKFFFLLFTFVVPSP